MGYVNENIKKHTDFFVCKWHESSDTQVRFEVCDKLERRRREERLTSKIDAVISQSKTLPDNPAESESEIEILKSLIVDLAGYHLCVKDKEFEDEFLSGTMSVTESFINQARDFDPEFKLIDIMQAMRNVWIMNIIQALSGSKIKYSKSIFAYSMLYPYTDNFLDSDKIPITQKQQFNKRLTDRLSGEHLNPKNELEEKIYSLVEMIEEQYPRKEFGLAYESILGIQQGQIESLKQHRKTGLSEYEVLTISARKGGTSVLADAYLVCGDLDDDFFKFIFGFGFALQLIDDLQDVSVDKKNGHMTVFSMNAGIKPLDFMVNRLIRFVLYSFEYDASKHARHTDMINKMISENCMIMIFEAVSKNKNFFSSKYVRELDSYSQLSFKFLKSIERKVKKNMGKLGDKAKNLK